MEKEDFVGLIECFENGRLVKRAINGIEQPLSPLEKECKQFDVFKK